MNKDVYKTPHSAIMPTIKNGCNFKTVSNMTEEFASFTELGTRRH
jgi:hypothetical protein